VLVRSPRAPELAALIAARGATVTPQPDGALVVTGLAAAAVGDEAAAHGIAVHALVPRQATLEQAYLDLTGESTDYRGTVSAVAPGPAAPAEPSAPAAGPAPAAEGTPAR